MRPVIYLVDDDVVAAKATRGTLEQYGFQVHECRRRLDFDRSFENARPDLCLLELNLADGDGLAIISDTLLPNAVPTIIVSGRGSLADRVVGLELGADDYIVKPFESRELVARIRALLRRTRAPVAQAVPPDRPFARFGDWTADFSGCTLTDSDGTVTHMSAAESALLSIFVKSTGRVLTRSQLLDLSDNREVEPFDRSIDARISRLRRKMKDDSKVPGIIRTVYGVGYVFALRVEWLEALD